MSYNEMFPDKQVIEAVSYTFEFGDQLLFGETITGSTVAASVYTGTDPTPMGIVSGSTSVNGTVVSQLIIGGVDGVIYHLVCVVNTSMSHVYSKSAYLAVINTVSQF